jgi:hypothetical protein
MKKYGEVDVLTHVFLISALAESVGQLYPRGKSIGYPLGRRFDGPQSRSGQHGERKFLSPPGLELRPLCSLDRSQSLYRLRYPGCVGSNSENVNDSLYLIMQLSTMS